MTRNVILTLLMLTFIACVWLSCLIDITKTINSKVFQTDDIYVPISTHTFANQFESTRANYSMITFMPRKDFERNGQNAVDDTQTKHHHKSMCVSTSATDEDEIYPVMVSEITAAQQKHRIYI